MSNDEASEEALEAAASQAAFLASAGRLIEAEQIIRSMPNDSVFSGWFHQKVTAVIAIAAAWASRGDAGHALRLAEDALVLSERLRSGGLWHEADALADIGSLMVKVGAADRGFAVWMRAVGLAQSCQDYDQDCGKILEQISLKFAAEGQWERADEIAGTIRFEYLRLRTENDLRNRRRNYPHRGVPP